MRYWLAGLLHRIEHRCARLRWLLKVRTCVGCACRWPYVYEADFDNYYHKMPMSDGTTIDMDCMEQHR